MLSDKVVIVAGAGHGLGEAAAVELGRQGATVVVNDLGSDVHGEGRSEEPAESTAAAVEAAGGTAMAHVGDVADLDYTERLVSETYEAFGRVDGTANFAGILRDAISYRMTGEEWDRVVRVHLRGAFSLLRNVAAHWRERAAEDGLDAQRSILNVSSRSALGNVGQANYSAAKAGVLGLTRATAKELARYDVRVNALMPTGFTRMIEDIPEGQRSFGAEEMPPERAAPMVAYLMSDAAEGITGTTIRAAGDVVGTVSNPEYQRLGFREGGWTVESLAERFREDVTTGIDLDRSGDSF
jgi:NAD(P)-dependent dehydrogenase (short-subunit alcohol dehydrogenase family)